MDQPRQIQHLADELLSEILAWLLEPGPRTLNGKLYNGNSHGRLAHDRPKYVIGEGSDLDRFRLVCKRFMRIGTPRKFSRFNLRFSKDGFRRLGELLEMQRACYVRTVTYLVRPFYQGSGTNTPVAPELESQEPLANNVTGWGPILQSLSSKDRALAQLHSNRRSEQHSLVENNHDLTQLCKGIAAFSSLQEIKLLRLQDGADEHLLDFIYTHSTRNAEGIDSTKLRFDWESACSRAVTNLGIALLDSQCTAIRFIGPQISPEATLKLLQAPSTTLAAMGSRLTSLDINFHANTDITATMSDLSSVFHRFFIEAKNLVAIHIGFPPKTPLDLSLESIFHNIRWKTLRTLSMQGWRLSADELTSLIRRHRRQLRDFRLSAVYLRPTGQWKDVLRVLRDETERLDRVELREIDYTEHFDALARVDGIEVFDNLPLTAPPSSISFAAGADPFITFPPSGPVMSLPPIQNTIKRVSVPRNSKERLRSLSVDELGDNGCVVQRDQVQLWAAWVMSGLQRDTNGFGNGNGCHAHGNGNGNGNGNGHFHAYHI